jgi:gamma-glutamylcyclotransferase (GGCT)/AIG2-like uncharacterized protein YtfP
MTKLFVYGTLRVGQGNHYLLKKGNAKFLGNALTFDEFDMIDVGFPVALPPNGPLGFLIKGEVYEIDDVTLNRVDILESEGRMYQRQTRTIWFYHNDKVDQNSQCSRVEMYVGIVDHWDGLGYDVERKGALYDWSPRARVRSLEPEE